MSTNKDRIGSVLLVGKTPLMMDAMSENQVFDVLVCGQPQPKDKESPRHVHAARGLYLGPKGSEYEGEVVVPAVNLYACLRFAGRSVPYKGQKPMISTAKTTRVFDLLEIDEEFLRLFLPDGTPVSAKFQDGHWIPDVRRGQNSSGQGACGIVRPKFLSWALHVPLRLTLNDHPTPEANIKKLFKVGGGQVGLCSFNPVHNGPFGRFTLAAWQMKVYRADSVKVAARIPKSFLAAAAK